MLHKLLVVLPLFSVVVVGYVIKDKIISSQAFERAVVASAVSDKIANGETARVIVTYESPKVLEESKPDRIKVKEEVSKGRNIVIESLPSGKEHKIHYSYQSVPALAMEIDSEALEKLSKNPDVVDISLDAQGQEALAESVPLIDADYVNRIIVNNSPITGNGVVVATIDSGLDTDHPDLAGAIEYEKCFISVGGCPPAPHVAEDEAGHGTMVAGIITSDGNVAKKGVAPGAKIAAYKVFKPGIGYGNISDWVAALDDIISNHPEVDIVNMSLASTTACPVPSLESAITTLRNLGVPTFIAAGNWSDKGNLNVPACIVQGISVGAVYDANIDSTKLVDTVPSWSSSAEQLDLLAPGVVIITSTTGGGTIWGSGTSFATPHAAGVAALLEQTASDLSVDEIEMRLKSTGKKITDQLNDSDPNTFRVTPRVDASVALLGDSDNDGCGDLAELQTAVGSEKLGGRRNPNNFWDFYDTNHDGAVSAVDSFEVLGRFGSSGDKTIDPLSSPPPKPAYHTRFDRGPTSGPNAWNLTAADGSIAFPDYNRVLAQFGHICK